MSDRPGPSVYSIAAHRGFADALVAGLIPRYSEKDFGLARLTLLLPSHRAVRTVTEAFVRQATGGLLLPRMVVVGDLDLDETLGSLFEGMDMAADVPPAGDPMRRWLRLAAFLQQLNPEGVKGPELLRRAHEFAGTIDRLLIEGIAPDDLMSDHVLGIVGELAGHWQRSTAEFLRVQAHWLSELAERGEVDAPTRRNLLFDALAKLWKETPPTHPVVATGVTSASPALARLLRTVADLPDGAVILPDLDLSLDDDVWTALGSAGKQDNPEDPPFGNKDAVTHPQYHLKLLLNRMGIARGEILPWHRSGLAAAPPERSRAISNLFLPPQASSDWWQLGAEQRRLNGVRLMQCAHQGEEAQAIALLIREALEVPERRVAFITPDRGLAARVVAQLLRWDIAADDTAGQPLPHTAAGRVFLLLAEVLAQNCAPVPLIALLTHPLVCAGEGRADWLSNARKLELALRGPRPASGLYPLAAIAEAAKVTEWWAQVEAVLSCVLDLGLDNYPLKEAGIALTQMLDVLCTAGEALCGDGLWAHADGRALATFVEQLRDAARAAGTKIDPADLHAVLYDAMNRIAVRPPWGGHPRVSIYGLLEARMARADLMICGGLTEGVWPANSAPDPLLAPAVMRALGVPGGDFRVGLAAHDLAAALGAPEVVLSWSLRDAGGPVIPSRFVLRIKAMLGDQAAAHEERDVLKLAKAIDCAKPMPPYPRPNPMPSAKQRKVDIAVTGLDRLRSDPFQFYASSILKLRPLDRLDQEPSAAWKGTAVHAILEEWHKAGGLPGQLVSVAERKLDEMNAHPLMRGLWRPRLLKALEWVDTEIVRLAAHEGRSVYKSEVWGDMLFKGVRVHGRADRIDIQANGGLTIVDYKTGAPPSRKMVQQGYSLQLGLIGLIAAHGGFKQVESNPTQFEYWSLSKVKSSKQKSTDKTDFGFVESPFATQRAKGIEQEDFLAFTAEMLSDAIDRWIVGEEPFMARMNPDLAVYTDYDQLMRLDEWLPSLTDDEGRE